MQPNDPVVKKSIIPLASGHGEKARGSNKKNVEAHNEIMTSRGLRSEKAANLENVLSTKFSLKHSLSIFVIAHLKSPNDAVNDLSGSV